jgi:hypothetical protein
MPTDRPPALWPYLLLNAVAATALDFSRLHDLHSSDSLIFSLAGLYEWRPFFWEQDRVGMVWPLLLSWCDQPITVLVLQTWIATLLGLCLPVLFARVLTPNPAGPLVATFANALVLALAPPMMIDNWLLVCNYPGALALCFGAVLLLDGRGSWLWFRLPVATALFVAAHWQYVGVCLFVAPLIVLRAWTRNRADGDPWWRVAVRPVLDRTALVASAGIAIAIAVVWEVMEHVRSAEPLLRSAPPRSLDPHLWAEALHGLARIPFAYHGLPTLANWVIAVAAVGLAIGLAVNRRVAGREVLNVLPAILAAAAEFAFLGTREWVWANDSHPRYLVAVGTAAVVSAWVAGLAPVADRLSAMMFRVTSWVAAVALLAVVIARFGPPDLQQPGRALDEQFGGITREVLAADVDAVSGGYWGVWPVVYHANATRPPGGDRVIVGIADRGEPMIRRLEAGTTIRVAVITADDPRSGRSGMAELVAACERYQLRLVSPKPIEHHGKIDVYLLQIPQP